jgi:hypothetical protein
MRGAKALAHKANRGIRKELYHNFFLNQRIIGKSIRCQIIIRRNNNFLLKWVKGHGCEGQEMVRD